MRVTVPASSANLGPGFDALGMALDVPFVLSTDPDDTLLAVEPRHPARVAFDRASGGAGGAVDLWWRSPIPPGRGMGFSGAARVAGALLGTVVARTPDRAALDRTAALAIACELEGHPDNAAASMLGGVVASSGGRSVRIPMALDLGVVVWWPSTETSTNRARASLPSSVPFDDAVFNVGRTAVLVAALAAGDRDALAGAMQDRLHQDARLAMSPASAVALDALRGHDGVVASWLSGSGPTVAAFVDPFDGERVRSALPADGTSRLLAIDTVGARLV